MRIPEAYERISEREINEIGSVGTVLRHKKTGASVFVLENDDTEKAFFIGFRTPAGNSTGKPHILEHSVLCGSKKYPVKDPFIQLEKSSLQTFLNAMTYPDKTIYPVASCNKKDLDNLMSVYLDAVFNPLFYENKKIFEQEGWHYQLADKDAPLEINGIVYNEMKGAFSDPEEVLFRNIVSGLYPDIPDNGDSGGNPKNIPELSFEEFLDYHKKHYHPSNSYIYLYGDIDMAERLEFIDNEYLSHYEKRELVFPDPVQEPFEQSRKLSFEFDGGEDAEGKDIISMSWDVRGELEPVRLVAMDILEKVLIEMEGAPVKEALIDNGIGEDVYGDLTSVLKHQSFTVVSKNIKSEDCERFAVVLRDALVKTVEEGLDKSSLRAAINSFEFQLREASLGGLPKGLIYGVQALESWLWDKDDPYMLLSFADTVRFLKDSVDTGYYENLIEKHLINNTHCLEVRMEARSGIDEEQEQEYLSALQAKKESLSAAEIESIVNDTAELLAFQEQPDSDAALASVPKLELADIGTDSRELKAEEYTNNGIPCVFHDTFSGGIAYLTLSFDINDMGEDRLMGLTLLRGMSALFNTENYTYRELTNEIYMKTGGIWMDITPYESEGDQQFRFEVKAKFLAENADDAIELVTEILNRSRYDDVKRFSYLFKMIRARKEQDIISSAHSSAVERAFSYFSKTSWYSDMTDGIGYLKELQAVDADDEEAAAGYLKELTELSETVFDPSGLIISITADRADLPKVNEAIGRRFGTERHRAPEKAAFPEPNRKNEGIIIPGTVNYVCAAGDFKKDGFDFSGSMNVLRKILGTGYIWDELRIKGGAYGGLCAIRRSGKTFFVSYRDPNLKNTYEIYERIADYLEHFDVSKREMTDCIISSIGAFDRPMSPAQWGAASFNAYMSGLTNEAIRKTREEILSTTPETIRGYAEVIRGIIAQNCICTLGTGSSIEDSRALFDNIYELV